jgi:hypothetical protein
MTHRKRDNRKTLYLLMDTETTKNNGLVFDFSYELFDRHGLRYEYGSFLFTDILAIEEPYFKEKIANYWQHVFRKNIVPLPMHTVRFIFNRMIKKYTRRNYKIIICAYNAAFDVSHLGSTSINVNKEKFLIEMNENLYFYDLWEGWCEGCPIDYGYTAPWTHENPGTINPKTGKPFPWNVKTSAESVYQYISGKPDFIEKHVAFEDIVIEKVILFDILKRKKKLHIVQSPKDFVSMPWKIVQERCKKPIEERIAKELAYRETMASLPDLKPRLDEQNKPSIIFPYEPIVADEYDIFSNTEKKEEQE